MSDVWGLTSTSAAPPGSRNHPNAAWLSSRRVQRFTVALLFLGTIYLFHSVDFNPQATLGISDATTTPSLIPHEVLHVGFEPTSVLNFDRPTTLAKENLRTDTHYLTAFAIAGFTNQFIAYMHLVYLSLQSGRVPIVPPFTPSKHIASDAGPLDFNRVFNISRTKTTLRIPIIEWADVKEYSDDPQGVYQRPQAHDPSLEPLGCWSVRQRDVPTTWPIPSENVLKLDLSFTRVPDFAFFDQEDQGEVHTIFSALASLIAPRHPHPAAVRDLPLMSASRLGSQLGPEAHLACFDFLYFVSSGLQRHEYEARWSPAWNTVGTHIRFTDDLMRLAESHIRRELGVSEGEDIPPMITVHIRRGDFRNICRHGSAPPCYIPLSKYRTEVDNVQEQLRELWGMTASRVLVASNERDPAFWEEISSLGWDYIDHTSGKTTEQLGGWGPVLIDVVALSMGIGFVGTGSSTVSDINAWRVEDWNGGVSSLVSIYE